MATIREEIVKESQRRQWSQLELSRRSGVAQSTISNYFGNQRDVGTATADKLFIALGLSVKGGRSRAK